MLQYVNPLGVDGLHDPGCVVDSPAVPDTASAELRRLAVLRTHRVLDTPPEEEFDRLMRLAARVFRVPVAMVGLLDHDRVFLKAATGVQLEPLPLGQSLCQWVLTADTPVVVNDTLLDDRCAGLPIVRGQGGIRFYAGMPVRAWSGEVLGTFCVADHQPRRDFGPEERERLALFARLVADRLARRWVRALAQQGPASFCRAAATAPMALLCTDALGRIAFANAAAQRMLERPLTALLGMTLADLLSEPHNPLAWHDLLGRTESEAGPVSPVLSYRRDDGSRGKIELEWLEWPEDPSLVYGVALHEVSVSRQLEASLFDLAGFDEITELGTRQVLKEAWQQCAQGHALPMLWLIELLDLREVNEQAGYRAGDAVLKVLARRTSLIFDDAVVVRLGGSRFGVLCADALADDELVARARQAMAALRAPVSVERQQFRVQVRLGVAQAERRPEGADLEACLANADLALFEARKQRSGFSRYTPGLREAVLHRKQLDRELRLAADLEQFELVFQPQIDLRSRRLIGAEALLRWNHPGRGQLRPALFIEALEASVVAAAVGQWVLQQACLHAARWRRAGLEDFRISVNLFAAQVSQDGLLANVASALDAAELDPTALELEITESTVLDLEPRLLRTLRELRQRGVGVAFDDYGTGFASLSLLKRLPLSRLKIDRSFIANLPADAGDAAVVEAILMLARQFGLGVIAEGVETPAQEQVLRHYDCPEVQGYMYGLPMSAREFWRQFGPQRQG